MGSHFGVVASPILEPILVVGLNRMFTGFEKPMAGESRAGPGPPAALRRLGGRGARGGADVASVARAPGPGTHQPLKVGRKDGNFSRVSRKGLGVGKALHFFDVGSESGQCFCFFGDAACFAESCPSCWLSRLEG